MNKNETFIFKERSDARSHRTLRVLIGAVTLLLGFALQTGLSCKRESTANRVSEQGSREDVRREHVECLTTRSENACTPVYGSVELAQAAFIACVEKTSRPEACSQAAEAFGPQL